jgi:glycerol uptake facilitator-like aquaporin
VGPYILVQIVGGILGVWATHFMFEVPILMTSQHVRTGPAQWFSEGVATFGLVAVIFGVAKTRPTTVPIAVGSYITAAYWFTSSTSFANPVVTIARSLTNTFTGIRPADAPSFIAAQLAGAALATAVFAWLPGPSNRSQPTEEES